MMRGGALLAAVVVVVVVVMLLTELAELDPRLLNVNEVRPLVLRVVVLLAVASSCDLSASADKTSCPTDRMGATFSLLLSSGLSLVSTWVLQPPRRPAYGRERDSSSESESDPAWDARLLDEKDDERLDEEERVKVVAQRRVSADSDEDDDDEEEEEDVVPSPRVTRWAGEETVRSSCRVLWKPGGKRTSSDDWCVVERVSRCLVVSLAST